MNILNTMNNKSQITFDQLLQLCEGKIPAKPPKEPGTMQGAFNGGRYIGTPGKDIYFFLNKLTEDQFNILVEKHSKQYPLVAPGNHLGYAACIRYIYGQFEKQGILRSEEDKKRMEKENLDWSLSRKFIFALQNKFKEQNNYYGLSITCEMEAHRMGDEAILRKDEKRLNEMKYMYLKSVEYAHQCNSYKQRFTPYYWSARYFMEFGDKESALYFAKKTIKEAERHCPDARASYVEKLLHCAKYLKKYDTTRWEKWRRRFGKTAKNRCVKKLFSKI